MKEFKGKSVLQLAGSLIFCLLGGVIGSLFTRPAIERWYAVLQKPAFNPPNWLFAPVWTALYILMGISLYLIWKSASSSDRRKGLTLFVIQWMLNVAWSGLFFGLRTPLWAFIEILILCFAIFLTIVYFYRVHRAAALLQIPYLIWVTFASFLNGFILFLN